MSAHTKGPWHVGEGKASTIVYSEQGYAVANATVYHGLFGDSDSAIARARLIAAAPDMRAELDAIDSVLARFAPPQTPATSDHARSRREGIRDVLEAIAAERAALAKAVVS